MLTNPNFTCHTSRRGYIGIGGDNRYTNNPGDGVGRVNYPALNPRETITLDDLRALNLKSVVYGDLWDPLEFCIRGLQVYYFHPYFERRFGQQDEIDEESDEEEDEKIEEETLSSDEDKENVKENAD